MPELVLSILSAMRVFFQDRADVALEVLALRQQLAVLKRKRPRPPLRTPWTGSSGLPCRVAGPAGRTSWRSSNPRLSSAGIVLVSVYTGAGILEGAVAGRRSPQRFEP